MRKLSLMEKLDDYRTAVRIFGPRGIGMVRAGRFGRIRGRRRAFDVFDYRNGRLVLTVRSLWMAKLLTAPAWHGPSFIRKLWSLTGMLDYYEQS